MSEQLAAMGKRPQPPQAAQALCVSGLALGTTEAQLRHYFLPFGPIVALHMPRAADGSLRGYARILYEDPADARAALANTDNGELCGATIRVSLARLSESAMIAEEIERWQSAEGADISSRQKTEQR